MGEVRHTYRARRDLIELWLAVRDVNPRAADELYKRLGARIQILEQFPEAGPLWPQLNPEARVLVEPPYLILYRIIPDGVQIVRVLHGARRIDRTLFIRGLE
ncbi:MAG: type II toxin-antitoxin system RelE/ParE family toxin [Stellaceae bacterium]